MRCSHNLAGEWAAAPAEFGVAGAESDSGFVEPVVAAAAVVVVVVAGTDSAYSVAAVARTAFVVVAGFVVVDTVAVVAAAGVAVAEVAAAEVAVGASAVGVVGDIAVLVVAAAAEQMTAVEKTKGDGQYYASTLALSCHIAMVHLTHFDHCYRQ